MTESVTRKIGDIDVVEISGRLDFGGALASIEKAILDLIEQGSRKLVIHVPELSSIDSSGIGMLMACSGQMEQRHGKLRIAGAQGGVARTFQVIHLGGVAPVDADLDAACRALEAAG